MTPAIELLWCEGCPSHGEALMALRKILAELDQPRAEIALRRIASEEEAVAERFVGSPTIRVDGIDLFPAAPEEPASLTCRLYRLRDGRVSPTPDPEDLRAALGVALAGVDA